MVRLSSAVASLRSGTKVMFELKSGGTDNGNSSPSTMLLNSLNGEAPTAGISQIFAEGAGEGLKDGMLSISLSFPFDEDSADVHRNGLGL